MSKLDGVKTIRVNKKEYSGFSEWCESLESSPSEIIRKIIKEAVRGNLVIKGNSKIKKVFK